MKEIVLAVDNLAVVQVLDALDYLHQKVLHLDLGQLPSLLQHLVQGVVVAQLEHDVNVLTVLKDVVEGDDVPVAERFVDLDFSN